MKTLIYTTLDQTLQNELRKKLPPESELIFKNNVTKSEIQNAFNSAEIIMGNPPAAWFNKSAHALKFWQIDSAGFNQYQHIKLDIR